MPEYICLKCDIRFEAKRKDNQLVVRCPKCKKGNAVVRIDHPIKKVIKNRTRTNTSFFKKRISKK